MRIHTTLTALAALTLVAGAPLAASADDNGRGNGNGRGHEGRQDGDHRGRGGDDDRGRGRGGDDRGPGRGRGEDRAERRVEQAERRAERQIDRIERRAEAREDRVDRRVDRIRDDARDRRIDRIVEVPVVRADRPDTVFFRSRPDRVVIDGCPPGLAKKNNGCLPPGLARQVERAERARYDSLWRVYYPDADRYSYRYDDGYVYRMTPQGGVAGWLPVLGGALGLGNVWPAQYQYQAPPTYYRTYYDLPEGDYRYADGVLYRVNPQDNAINSIVALLTGQPLNVGQALPSGYDVYNVPYAYRNQYVDGPNALYRYSDGYVYQVDPTTRLIQAAIQLLA